MSKQNTNDNEIILQLMNEEGEIECVECFKCVLKENINNGHITTNMLQSAASYGLLDECKLLIAKGLDVNQKNDLGWTPVMQAVQNDHYLVTKMFIECGGNVDLCNSYGISAVALAVLSKDLLLLQLVLEASDNQDNRNNNLKLALELACLYGLTNIVQWLVSSTVLNLNEPSSLSDLTPLMLATTTGHVDIVKILLDHGSDPLVTNSLDHSAFDIACYKNDLHIKPLLYRSKFPSPYFLSSPISPHCSSPFATDNLSTFVLPNHIAKRHFPLVPLSPFAQTPQFSYNVSPCCLNTCRKSSSNLPSFTKPFQDCHSSGSWCISSWDNCIGHSDIAALVSPQLMKKYSDLQSQKNSTELNSPKKGKKRKLFDKEWCSSWIKKLNKKRTKPLDDSTEPTEFPIKTSNYVDFSQLLFGLELEEYWQIFKEHELDIGVFLTLTAEDLNIMGIKDKESQTIILNKIESLKRTQL